jgi:hypothetical protein
MFLWYSRKDAEWFRSCVTNRKYGYEIKSHNETNFFPPSKFGTVEYGTPQRVSVRAISFHNMHK